MSKSYLGDGVYVDVERGMLKLTTEDGISTTNEIFLDPAVYESLVKYVDRLRLQNETPPAKLADGARS